MYKNATILTDHRYKEHIEFWKENLSRLNGNFNFTQLAGIANDGSRGSYAYHLNEETIQLLNRLSNSDALGKFVLLTAGFHNLMRIYNNANTTCIDTPLLSGNDLEKGLSMQVPMIATHERSSSLRAYLKNIQANVSSAYSFQNFPISDVYQLLDHSLEAYKTNIYIKFSEIHDPNRNPSDQDSLSVYDMIFDLTQEDQKLVLKIDYNSELYESTFIESIGQHLETFISYYENLDERMENVQILDRRKQEAIIGENNTNNDVSNETVLTLFRKQVEKTPDHPAVKYKSTVLSYKELDEKSDHLAQYLRKEYNLGVEDKVAVVLPKSAFSIIALLAIMKSGGCYVPLHHESPPERLKQFCDQANVKLLLTHSELLPNLQSLYSIPMFVMDIQLSNLEASSIEHIEVKPDNLAYIIFTSGSTGIPKGIMVAHKSIVNIATDYIEEFDVNEKDHYLQLLSMSFDGSILDIFTALLAGAQLVIPHKEILEDPNEFELFIEEQQISMMVVTPSYLASLEQRPLKSLRLIISAGEAAKVSDAKFYSSNKKFYNAYGPTECTVDATLYQVDPELSYEKIPLGKPRKGYKVYLINDHNELVPEGIIGEICIAGIGLARGYLQNEENTGAFCEDLFLPGERIYKTGDLGYWNSDGNLEYVDRKDHQTKYRGYRIDTIEIENTVRKFQGVADAFVTVNEGSTGNSSIVCYVIMTSKLDTVSLKAYLSEMLPDYMVPQFIIEIDHIPLNSNGKIDQDQLPDIDFSAPDREYQPPRNLMEEKLVHIWKELFDLSEISINDNFFELGGHSLNSMKFISRIQEEFDFKIDPVGIFKNPTVEELASFIKQPSEGNAEITPAKQAKYYPLSHGQRRLWTLHQISYTNIVYNIPNGFLLHDLKPELFIKAFSMLIARHEILRTTFTVIEGAPFQQIHEVDNDRNNIRYLDISEEKNTEDLVKSYSKQMASYEFDLERGPLLVGKLIKISNSDFIFLLTMHHIISDGWSQGVIVKEMSGIYKALLNNEEVKLADLKLQFKDFAVWQNENAKQSRYDVHRAFWKTYLSRPLPKLALPSDFSRPSIKSFNGSLHYFSLDSELKRGLKELSRKGEISLFAALVAVVKTLLFKYTGELDMLLGMTTSGRNQSELEDQIGFYVNTLPLRTKLNRRDSFNALLQNVKENILNAFEHQDYAFDQIVNDLNLERDPSRSPLFDVLVELLNVDTGLDTIDEMGGKAIGGFENDLTTSKYDLTFKFKELKDLQVYIEYNTDLYTEERILEMEGHLKELVQNILREPEAEIGKINYLNANQRDEAKSLGIPATKPFPEKTVIQLFEAQAEKEPNAIATDFNGTVLTYQELNELANGLSAHLIETYDVKPSSVIAFIAERSDRIVASMLSVLKTGATFLFIDPSYPSKRIANIIKDAGVQVVLTDADKVLWLSDFYEGNIFAMDVQLPLIETSNVNTRAAIDMGQIAYMIYTSGSTGAPKGVNVSHKSISNYISWANDYYFGEENTVNFPLFTSLSFDLTLTSVLCTLSKGGKLHVYENEQIGEVLKDIFTKRSDINVVKLTPSLISALDHLSISQTDVKIVIAGGEVLREKHVEILKRMNPEIRIFNEYGPTEATVGCIVNEISEIGDLKAIGKPISNAKIYIVDEDFNLKPVGQPGEICIGGACLAKGYHNLPELTSEKFIANPFEDGERIYLSGDVGRWDQNRNIEFLGRKDDQLKVNGFRIEPSEIEKALLTIEKINQVSVLAQGLTDETVSLVCYYTGEEDFNKTVLVEHLESTLPKFMIPHEFVYLSEMPLSSNGKIDKRTLKEAVVSLVNAPGEGYVAPDNELQELLVQFWSEILSKENIGINDNFFDIGGDSLKVIQLNSKINEHFPGIVEVYNIFSNPTPKKLEKFIEAQRASTSEKVHKIVKVEL